MNRTGVRREAKSLKAERDEDRLPASPPPSGRDGMAETINSILQLRSLEEDWDLDGAQPIAELAIDHATRFVGLVDEMAEQAGLSWQDPVTGPVADGSVALTWDTGARQTLTIFRPQQLPLVVCVTRERGGRSTRQVVSPEDAAQQVLWAWDPDGK